MLNPERANVTRSWRRLEGSMSRPRAARAFAQEGDTAPRPETDPFAKVVLEGDTATKFVPGPGMERIFGYYPSSLVRGSRPMT
jgi:hypothetical protein